MHRWAPLRDLMADCPSCGFKQIRRMAASDNPHKREKAALFAYQNRNDERFEEFRPMWERFGYGVKR